tara:strand:- start:968 stop:1075 length:108 start_codon:yes stop_codon:yes gene_type:complete
MQLGLLHHPGKFLRERDHPGMFAVRWHQSLVMVFG